MDKEVVHAGGRNLVLQAFEVHAMITIAEQNFLFREVVLPAGVVCVFPVVHLSLLWLLCVCFVVHEERMNKRTLEE